MGILLSDKSKVMCQGITGRKGLFHARICRDYGTNIVGGVNPRKGGATVEGFHVYGSVEQCVRETGADVSMVFVPAPSVKSAVMEAADAGVRLIVIITEGIPIRDMLLIKDYIRNKNVLILGPNTPGLAVPDTGIAGIIPSDILMKGSAGIVSRSGTLTYEAVMQTSKCGIGQSAVIGIGGDKVIGLGFAEVLKMLDEDEDTKSIILIGEIGGAEEIKAAHYIKTNISKPVFAYIAGITAPPDRRMGHAGAMVTRKEESALAKIGALREAGAVIIESVCEIGKIISMNK